jgi:hypothetical protein
MKERLMYVEAITSNRDGEAWIGLVSFSKTGATLYFNGCAYSVNSKGASAYCCNTETGARCWISGVKKRGTNRHRFGTGKIRVDRRAVPALIAYLGATELDSTRYVVADAADTATRRAELHQKANESLAASWPDGSVMT